MELTSAFRAAPGRCLTCGSADSSKPVIDLEVVDPGVMNRTHRCYLCESCALEVANLIATATGRVVLDRDVSDELARARDDAAFHKDRADRAEGLLRDLREFVAEGAT